MEMLHHAVLFLGILIVFVLVSVIAENLYWKTRQREKVYGIKEVIGNFFLGASYKAVDAVAIAVYVYFLYDIVSGAGLQIDLPGGWIGFVIVYILVDLFFYVTHFVMHKVRWFWAGHVTHHSSSRYNYSVALRQNFTLVLNGAMLIWWMPLALIGVDKEVVLLAIEVNLLYQFFLHTEMPSPLDKLGLIFNTPSHHRVHHGCNKDQIDRNFGGTLIIWDRIFGSFRAEKDAGEIIYGITYNQPKGYNPISLLFHEWRDMFSDAFRMRSFWVFTKTPDWVQRQNADQIEREK
ncbi:MAG: sterol desaturase family protein [Robiginitomaculum sp.]|nr:sterol desaturase family protein [Robiginitomaculum sp.]